MGRADQTTKVRGMFVHPHQIAEIVRRHPDIVKARLTVRHAGSADAMLLACEAPDTLELEAVKNSIREVTKLRGDVQLVARGSLPNDGKVIEDSRSYT
jgi:phenylacetate-CoA ligase